jgi:hypothetical protein
VDWDAHLEREAARYADALLRLPDEPDSRQKQLVRAAMAAGGAGLASLMQGREQRASDWFLKSADRYRESWEHAPPGSWGRLLGMLKSRLLAGDAAGARVDAEWALAKSPAAGGSPIGTYAAVLAQLVVGRDEEAALGASSLLAAGEEAFPTAVAEALGSLAAADGATYAQACAAVLASFEERDAYLDDIAVADTVIVLEALAEARGIASRPSSKLLPPG